MRMVNKALKKNEKVAIFWIRVAILKED